MRLRPYIPCRDFDAIRGWIADERAHALWCANHIPYPLEQAGLEAALRDVAMRFGDSPYVATMDDGRVIGFFCYSVNPQANEGMLKFVMIDSGLRGHGYGREMLRLLLRYAFEITGVDAVLLNVFPENARAKRCYLGAGFVEKATAENAFHYGDELWGRCTMIARRGDWHRQ